MQFLKFIKSFIGLVFIVGFPRIYGTEIPIAVLFLPFFISGFLKSFIGRAPLVLVLIFVTFIFGFSFGVISYLYHESDFKNIFFHFVIYSKIFLIITSGYITYRLIKSCPHSLLGWIIFQLIIIILSSLNTDFYRFLLGFISPRTALGFEDFVDLRVVGFGIYHMDGAYTLSVATFMLPLLFNKNKSNFISPVLISFPFSVLVSRTALVPYFLFFILGKNFIIKFYLVIIIFIIIIISSLIESGPLLYAFDLFRNIATGGGFSISGLDHLYSMYVMPDNFGTYLIGDGFYYGSSDAELEFYMGTDVGYLRILYFSGSLSVAIFIGLNIFLPLIGYFRAKSLILPDFTVYFLVCILSFLIINAKGIQVIPVFAITAFFIIMNTSRNNS